MTFQTSQRWFEESDRDVYCANEHFDDVRKCNNIRALHTSKRIPREMEDLWNCVLGPRQVNCN